MKNNKEMLAIIIGGFLLRLISSYVGYGFIAFDEYFIGMDPAGFKLLVDNSYKFADVARTPLLFYFDYAVFFIANKLFGISSPLELIKFAGAFLGALSMLGVWMCYKLVLNISSDKKNALLCAFILSFYFVMPFICTRLMIESVSAIVLMVAVYFWSKNNWFWFALLLGISSMFRFQNGVIYIGVLVYVMFVVKNKAIKFIAGGLVALLLQIFLDYSVFGGFLTSLINYTKLQLEVITQHSRQPWFNFILLFIGLSLPLASLATLPAVYKAAMKYKVLGIMFVVFVVAHSFSPHKEDRFMIPVLPLFLLLMGLGLKEVKKYYKFSMRWFWTVNFVLLVPVIISPTMSNLIDAMDYSRKNGVEMFVSDSPITPRMFAGYKQTKVIKKDEWKDYFCTIDVKGLMNKKDIYVHSIFPQDQTNLAGFAKECGVELEYLGNFKGGFIDQILARLNAKFNYRRANGHLYKLSLS